MFDFAWTELLIVAAVALVVIGPKELPRTLRTVGQWVGKARDMARHFRTGMDAMIREAELEEMDKKWKADNERIMREHPPAPSGDWGKPAAPPPASDRPAPPAPPAPAGSAPARSAPPPAPPRDRP